MTEPYKVFKDLICFYRGANVWVLKTRGALFVQGFGCRVWGFASHVIGLQVARSRHRLSVFSCKL